MNIENIQYKSPEKSPESLFLSQINERVFKAKKTGSNTTNCLGSALYILGLSEVDKFSNNFTESLLIFTKKDYPRCGYLCLWKNENGIPVHVGVISQVSPKILIHSRQAGGYNLEYSEFFDALVERCGKNYEFYEPPNFPK